ncbi:bacterial bifunctional deaminase-reductase [Xylariaceae sp. FL0255]|nr:bacterial bifunctional deaminase-reductase [Xylariaceae sp. FL0255]
MAEAQLSLSFTEAGRLEPHLPRHQPRHQQSAPIVASLDHESPSLPSPLPFVTLTFATSLDSALSLGPGIRTSLSGPQSKAMTHYLRSRHDAICVGVGTAVADDPGLNCRLAESGSPQITSDDRLGSHGSWQGVTAQQPRPIVIDPRLRWDFTPDSKVIRLAREGQGLAPYIITASEPPAHKRRVLEDVGGKCIVLPPASSLEIEDEIELEASSRFNWRAILNAVRQEGLRSIMIEGGGQVINSLLSKGNAEIVDSVIVTIAPTWLGKGGVVISPPRELDGQDRPVARLVDTVWIPLGEDVVLCGRIQR